MCRNAAASRRFLARETGAFLRLTAFWRMVTSWPAKDYMMDFKHTKVQSSEKMLLDYHLSCR